MSLSKSLLYISCNEQQKPHCDIIHFKSDNREMQPFKHKVTELKLNPLEVVDCVSEIQLEHLQRGD